MEDCPQYLHVSGGTNMTRSFKTNIWLIYVVIFNICLEVAYDSMRLIYWYLHYIYDLILYLCHVLYRVLSYWYLLYSRKANFYVIHKQ